MSFVEILRFLVVKFLKRLFLIIFLIILLKDRLLFDLVFPLETNLVDAIHQFFDNIKSLEVRSIFLDISKAFDKV